MVLDSGRIQACLRGSRTWTNREGQVKSGGVQDNLGGSRMTWEGSKWSGGVQDCLENLEGSQRVLNSLVGIMSPRLSEIDLT